jgi:hypothetical protein
MSRMMIYINYPLSSQLTKFVTVTLTFVTVSYIVSYVRNQPESYTLTSLVIMWLRNVTGHRIFRH